MTNPTTVLSTLLRLLIAAGLATVVLGQVGTTPVTLLAVVFLATVVCTPARQTGVN